MTHGGRDPASVLACFDQFGAAVFGSLCHLTAGDAAAAQLLLIRTFAHDLPAPTSAYDSAAGSLDRRAVIVSAHHCYLRDPQAAAVGSGPVTSLTPTERVVLNLEVAEHMRSPEINFAVRMAENDADYVAEAAHRRLQAETFGRPAADVFAACEVWFDDSMRSQCRAEIEHALSFAPPPTDADGIVVQGARSRRLTIGGSIAAAIVAAVALGAWLAPSNDDPGTNVADLAPSTLPASSVVSEKDPSELPSSTSTTIDGAPSGEDTPARRGFILNPPPDGFVVNSAKSEPAAQPPTGWLEVWSTPNATRNDGRWFAVRTGGDRNPVLQNATRGTIGANATLTAVDVTGVSSLYERLPDGSTAVFETFGFTADEVRQLVLATAIGDNGVVQRTARLEAVTRRMEVLWSGPTYGASLPPALTPDREHAYYRSANASQQIDVVTAPQVANDLAVTRLLTPSPMTDAFGTQRMVVLSDVGALVGRVPAPLLVGESGSQPDLVFAQWHSGTHTVTVTARAPIEAVIQIARAAHMASAAQWATMGNSVSVGMPQQAPRAVQATSLGRHTTKRDDTWNVVAIEIGCPAITFVNQTDVSGSDVLSLFGGETAFCVTPDPSQPLLEFAGFDVTFLVVVFDSEPTATRLSVDAGNGPHFTPIEQSDNPVLFGAGYAFSEDGLYVAQLWDDTATPIQQLTPVPLPEAAA